MVSEFINFPLKNFQVFSEHTMNLNLKIENKIFTYTKFEDISIENNYQNMVEVTKKFNYFGDSRR